MVMGWPSSARSAPPYLTTGNRIVGNFIGTNELGNYGTGVWLYATTNNVIGGSALEDRNYITGSGHNGIEIQGPETSGTVIQGNYIGNPLGVTLLTNSYSGVLINDSSGHTVGGGGPGEGNVISGNLWYGVQILYVGARRLGQCRTRQLHRHQPDWNFCTEQHARRSSDRERQRQHGRRVGRGRGESDFGQRGPGVHVLRQNALPLDNQVVGNRIGTDTTGMVDLGNAGAGVHVEGAERTSIGGAAPTDRNVISGNNQGGIFITNPNPTGPEQTRVLGNLIGTDITGTVAVANNGSGILIFDASGQRIGGMNPGEGNVISGNNGAGIRIAAAAASADSNGVFGNFIGTDATGTARLGNFTFGVDISHGFYNSIGLAEAGAGT